MCSIPRLPSYSVSMGHQLALRAAGYHQRKLSQNSDEAHRLGKANGWSTRRVGLLVIRIFF